MHFGFLSIGLISGGTAAVAAFNLGGGLFSAILCYSFFGFGAVYLGAFIWAMTPHHVPIPIRNDEPIHPNVERDR